MGHTDVEHPMNRPDPGTMRRRLPAWAPRPDWNLVRAAVPPLPSRPSWQPAAERPVPAAHADACRVPTFLRGLALFDHVPAAESVRVRLDTKCSLCLKWRTL